jgi:cytochrome c
MDLRSCVKVTILIAGVFLVRNAQAAGDPVQGKIIFDGTCHLCHEAEIQRNGGGPYLKGVVGRPAASTDFRRYSLAMKASGIIWDESKIRTFIKNPKAFVPGTAMFFPGLKSDDDIANVAAYLAQESQKPSE